MSIPTTDGGEMRLEVNAQTGKLRPVWVNGDVAFDDTGTETAMSLLCEDDGPFTSNRRRGPGPLSVTTDNADAPSMIKARAEERLQLAVDDGRWRSFSVDVSRPVDGQRGRLMVTVDYITRTGKAGAVKVPIG